MNAAPEDSFLRLFYDLATYNAIPALAQTQFVDPVHPGAAPSVPNSASTAHFNRILQEHSSDLNQVIIQANTDKAATEQLMAAVDQTYYQILKDPDDGCADLTLHQLVTCLTTTYGEVTADNLNANEKRLEKQWSPTQPLEDLWTQAKQAKASAKDHDPISNTCLIRVCTNNLEESGVFNDALKKQRSKTAADKTWATLQTHFNEANKERLRAMTTGQCAANKVKTDNNDINVGKVCFKAAPPMRYCWSQGFRFNTDHTGHTCKNCQEKHQPNVTFFNMMGGCNRIHRITDEKAIWKPQWVVKKDADKENAGSNNP